MSANEREACTARATYYDTPDGMRTARLVARLRGLSLAALLRQLVREAARKEGLR